MAEKPVLYPGPDHPITVTPNQAHVVVTVAGKVVADTQRALTLQESTYPAVQYIPIADVDTGLLERTETMTYCPFKGDASYYSIPVGGERSVDAIWVYETPREAVAEIKDHVAFYPNRSTRSTSRPEQRAEMVASRQVTPPGGTHHLPEAAA